MHNKFMKNHTILSLFLLLITGCGAGGYYPSWNQAVDACREWENQSKPGRVRICDKEIQTRQYLGYDMAEDERHMFYSKDIKAHFRW